MHTHQSLWSIAEQRNAFAEPRNQYGLSTLAQSYMAGILAHARGMIAVLAPLVNSYKRLVPGLRGADLPDLGPDEPLGAHPGAEGLARQVDRGHARRGALPRPVLEHVPRLRGDARGRPRRRREGHAARPTRSRSASTRWTRRGSPRRASASCRARSARRSTSSRSDEVIREALGDHVFNHYLDAKRDEWDEYRTQVSDWEVERYLDEF